MMKLEEKLMALGVIEMGNFTLSSGEFSAKYFNIKKAYGVPEIMNEMADNIFSLFGKEVTCVAGAGYGGIPLAAAVSSRHNMPLTLIREMKKEYGTKSQIEGYMPNQEDKIAIVDDVFTTGKSLAKSIKILEGFCNIEGCYVVVKRDKNKFTNKLEYLFRQEDFKH